MGRNIIMEEESEIFWGTGLEVLSGIFRKKVYFISYDENTKELKVSFKRRYKKWKKK